MSGPKTHKYRTLDRRRRVAELYLAGRTQYECAREVGVSQPAVSKILASLRDEWLAAAREDFDHRKALELARLDRLEAEAWRSFELSRRPLKEGGEERAGNPRFLDTVKSCIEARMKACGLIRPNQVVQQTTVVSWDSLVTAAREERAANPDPIAARLRAIEAELASTPPQLLPASTNGTANYNGG